MDSMTNHARLVDADVVEMPGEPVGPRARDGRLLRFRYQKQAAVREGQQPARSDPAGAAQISMLGELAAYIAHELSQPLSSIELYGATILRWLAQPEPDIGEIETIIQRIIANERRAGKIIDRVRAMATRCLPEPTLLSLDDVVGEALLFLAEQFETSGVTVVHATLSDSAHAVLGDRTQLQQVIVNLALNAVQAMARSGDGKRRLTVRTFLPDPGTLCCSVEDSGPGIDPQRLALLFRSSFTTKDSGMGMGLRICRTVVEAHDGKIGADNRSSHGGARFFFTLPVADMT